MDRPTPYAPDSALATSISISPECHRSRVRLSIMHLSPEHSLHRCLGVTASSGWSVMHLSPAIPKNKRFDGCRWDPRLESERRQSPVYQRDRVSNIEIASTPLYPSPYSASYLIRSGGGNSVFASSRTKRRDNQWKLYIRLDSGYEEDQERACFAFDTYLEGIRSPRMK